MVKCPLCIARELSPKGKVKKQSLYSRQPSAQISALVVIGLPQYMSTISGARYERVVNTVKELIAGVLSEELLGRTYDAAEKTGLQQRHYKLVVIVSLGEQRGEGVRMCSRALWDADTDTHASHLFLNPGSLETLCHVSERYSERLEGREWILEIQCVCIAINATELHHLCAFWKVSRSRKLRASSPGAVTSSSELSVALRPFRARLDSNGELSSCLLAASRTKLTRTNWGSQERGGILHPFFGPTYTQDSKISKTTMAKQKRGPPLLGELFIPSVALISRTRPTESTSRRVCTWLLGVVTVVPPLTAPITLALGLEAPLLLLELAGVSSEAAAIYEIEVADTARSHHGVHRKAADHWTSLAWPLLLLRLQIIVTALRFVARGRSRPLSPFSSYTGGHDTVLARPWSHVVPRCAWDFECRPHTVVARYGEVRHRHCPCFGTHYLHNLEVHERSVSVPFVSGNVSGQTADVESLVLSEQCPYVKRIHVRKIFYFFCSRRPLRFPPSSFTSLNSWTGAPLVMFGVGRVTALPHVCWHVSSGGSSSDGSFQGAATKGSILLIVSPPVGRVPATARSSRELLHSIHTPSKPLESAYRRRQSFNMFMDMYARTCGRRIQMRRSCSSRRTLVTLLHLEFLTTPRHGCNWTMIRSQLNLGNHGTVDVHHDQSTGCGAKVHLLVIRSPDSTCYGFTYLGAVSSKIIIGAQWKIWVLAAVGSGEGDTHDSSHIAGSKPTLLIDDAFSSPIKKWFNSCRFNIAANDLFTSGSSSGTLPIHVRDKMAQSHRALEFRSK
ncbi:hypothetical protein B566_EDAN001029 [Ephemera danica]|nr:hypothetical protein B566_EDAN001029 [Ephemera danica]